ncbi:hypothetical protein ACQP25_28230 [Microtetraspora malaysiensis]|uniref:hypothetical protein n=1 Tax=Microtetraspora malaysiensis TaxID=161358 RepID=UPI003D8EC3DE
MSPTLLFAVRVLLAGLVVAAVGIVGKDRPGLAGMLSAFPVVMFLSMFVLWRDGTPRQSLATFCVSAAVMLVPTGLALASVALVLHWRSSLPLGLSIGAVVWFAGALVVRVIMGGR